MPAENVAAVSETFGKYLIACVGYRCEPDVRI
jgi:hypothetical protein